jgi:phosphatidylglycerophosphatase A
MSHPPTRRFLLSHPVHFLALGFGTGLAPKAPGTFGTLLGLPLYAALMLLPETSHLIVIALLFLIGIPICQKAGDALGVSDHGSIVWDEIVAMMLVLEFTPRNLYWWAAAFMLFRLFDIWKPFPIRQCDARLKGGFGVMFDDLLAALYAIASLKALLWLTMHL